ncbi:UNVERIFIED_CONTAM: NAC domain-containing protein 68 [Sesamum radiatum]|uniref:NAC domain-containing protein 68 n=1 Tax=Sesamum radiatum TaxID=300843 RepID=A0AAW2W4T0_SESRA
MSSSRICMSSSDLNMNAVVQEGYPGSSSTSTMNCLPVGYRFLPTDAELVVHYLKRKVNNQPLPYNTIHTVNLYELRPEDLCAMFGGKEWYLFCPRKRRSNSGTRADRTTPYGYWKATCGDKAIRHNAPSDAPDNVHSWLSDEIVLCRIHNHNKKYKSNNDGATNYVSNQWNQPNPIRALEDVGHQQQQTFSAGFEDSGALAPATTFTTPLGMPEIDELLFLGSDSPKQGCSDQYKSSSNDLFDDFDELMKKSMEFLPDMSMDF